MGRVFGGVHLCQDSDAEFVLAHGGLDARVISEAREIVEGARRVREIWEWEEGVEGVGCFVLSFLAIDAAVCRGRFGGRISGGGPVGGRRREKGEVAGGWGEELDLLVAETAERRWGIGEGVLEKADFWNEEFLRSWWNREGHGCLVGKIYDCRVGGK